MESIRLVKCPGFGSLRVLALTAGVIFSVLPAVVALEVATDITNETVWVEEDSPVLISNADFMVTSNGTLRIEGGVTVLVSGRINVEGELHVEGTAEKRVLFDEAVSGEGWGYLRFAMAVTNAYRTNVIEYADLKNMHSYIYISEQSLRMEHSTMVMTSSGWYGMAAYVNSASGNPAQIALVSNAFDIMIPRHDENNVTGIILDGFPCRLAYNTISLTTTGTIQEVEGIRFYRSNTTAFRGDLIGNSITVDSSLPGDTLQVYGVHYESDTSGVVSNNLIRAIGPQSVTAVDKIDDLLIISNTISVLGSATNLYGYLIGIKNQATSAGSNDLIVNNRIDVSSTGPSRYMTGIACQEGRVRGNCIRLIHSGDSGYVRGIAQVYYEGYLDNNTIWAQAVPALSVRGIDVSTHYNASESVYVYNNLLYNTGSTNSAGIYRDSGAACPLTNSHNLVYGFGSSYVNCTAGMGAVTADPQVVLPELHLSVLSPAINAGTNQTWMSAAIDLDEDGRIDQGTVDIGCDEYHVLASMSSTSSSPVRVSSIPVTVLFSEPVHGFETGDVWVENGVVTNLSGVSSTNYTLDILPQSQGAVNARVMADSVTNSSGVSNSRSILFSREYNPNPPDLEICSMTVTSLGVAAGTTFDVTVVISNGAGSASELFRVFAWADHSVPAYTGETGDVWQTVNGLASGAIQEMTLSGLAAGSTPGYRTLRVFADSWGVVSESDEDNNQQTLGYVVYGSEPFALSAFAITNSVVLRWSEPMACGSWSDSVQLRHHSERYPTGTNDGVLCYSGTNCMYCHTNLSPGVTVYYSIWVTDDGTNYVAP